MAHEKDRWLTLGESFSGSLTNASTPPRDALEAATRLFGFYRASEASDPKTFIAGAAAILARYPVEIVRQVCNPVVGLPSESKWLPSLNEIREACEKLMQPVRDQERRDRVREETLAGRRTGKAPVGLPEHQRVLEGFQRLRPSPPTQQQYADHLAKLQAEYEAKPVTLSQEALRAAAGADD